MFKFLKSLWDRTRTAFYPLSSVPPNFFRPSEYNLLPHWRINSGDQALMLSPFFAALRLYQTAMASLPLIAYTKDDTGSRERLKDKATFNLLHERPNPAQSRASFFECLLADYWLEGECFVHIQWANNHRLLGLYPLHARNIRKVEMDDNWQKTYYITGQEEPYEEEEIIHVIHFSRDGIRGLPFLTYAAESLGLHKQIMDTAASVYRNRSRIAGQITQETVAFKETATYTKQQFIEEFSGALNAGKTPLMPVGMKFEPVDTQTAEANQIIEALNVSSADVGRWFDNLSPLLLGDLSRGTYSNSAADKLAFYQKNLLPVLDKFQLEFNYKLFGAGSDTYCEFLTDNVLRADPKTQADVWHLGLQDGYLLKSEVREWLNLPAVPGLDVPTTPVNMQPVEQPDVSQEDASEEPSPDLEDTEL